MKTLTVCQPWAWLIVAGIKRIENRSWRCHSRGPFAIHAGKSRKWINRDCDTMRQGIERRLLHGGRGLPGRDELVYGAVIGVVDVVDVVEVDDPLIDGEPFREGPWCWVLRNARAIEPIECNGKQMLWEMELC